MASIPKRSEKGPLSSWTPNSDSGERVEMPLGCDAREQNPHDFHLLKLGGYTSGATSVNSIE